MQLFHDCQLRQSSRVDDITIDIVLGKDKDI
jgi:hypothetical protein